MSLIEQQHPPTHRAVGLARAAQGGPPGRAGRRHELLGAVVAVLGCAAASLLFGRTPTYDPWAWIVWGREVMQLDLSTTGGPSWKPLPVLFTSVFSLAGPAAPALWVLVARSGGIAAVVLAFRLGRYISGGLAGGVAAAVAVLIAPWMLRSVGLANSEGLLVAAVLGAVLALAERRHRPALGLGLAAALLRPEAWPFFALLVVWLWWHAPGDRWMAVTSLFALALLWFIPEYLGSGNLLRAAERAQQPLGNSAAFARHPALTVIENAGRMLTWPLWLGLAALTAAIARGTLDRSRARLALGLAGGAVVWLGVVAVMTRHGFSGNQRYLIMPVVVMLVLGGAGLGLLAARVPQSLRVPAVALVTLLVVLPSAAGSRDVLRSLRYQSQLGTQLTDVVAQAGGAARLRACGTAFTGPFEVPAVAWHLHEHTSAVQLMPHGRRAVVFRAHTNRGSRAVPSLAGLEATRTRTLAATRDWRVICTR